jgi:hypothetical protein
MGAFNLQSLISLSDILINLYTFKNICHKMALFSYNENDPDSPSEIMLRDYLEKKIQDYVTPLEKLSCDYQEKLNYDYLDLRGYLQNMYLKYDDFEKESFGSFMFHLMQNRRESNENLFYMSKMLTRTKSPLAIYMIIYSNYSERMHKKRIKLLYPMDEDFGDDISYVRNFYFNRFDLRNYKYPIYFAEINAFLNLILENAQGMIWNYNLFDYLDYYIRTIHNNKISPDKYEKTLKNGCRIPIKGFDAFYRYIALTKNIPLIIDTIMYAIGEIEKFKDNISTEYGYGDEYYVSHQFVEIKFLIDMLAITPFHQEEFETIFKQLDKYPKLSDVLYKAREKQAKLLKKPDFEYRPRAGTIEPLTDFGDPDHVKIAHLRYGDFNLKLVRERCKYPEKIIPFKSGDDATNQVRDEFDIPRIGEGWANETYLFKLVSMLMDPVGAKVIHHYRPKFLSLLELDIFFEYNGQKVGIEYQGQQHYEPVGYFGGEESFKQTQERDKRKKQLCDENGITLIYFDYGDTITQNLILERLKKNGIEIRFKDPYD